VHVNVSAHQLKQDGFVENVQALLRAARLPSQALELEMTESALIEHSTRTSGLLAALKKIGVKIALDDFGTGFSSLSYLKTLPVDTIKIDKSFIDDLPAAGRDAALVESILTLGARLGNNVVAEGVETAPQIDWLVSHGCLYLQGHHFSKPVPLDQFLTLVTSRFEIPTVLGKPHRTERLGVLAANKR
jgi:EAL domain-containing protein (putative c-di-GMP-specific phosphodiesterase class I)